MAGEYNLEAMVRGLSRFVGLHAASPGHLAGRRWMQSVQATKEKAAASLGALPVRPPTFCVGCPSARCSRR